MEGPGLQTPFTPIGVYPSSHTVEADIRAFNEDLPPAEGHDRALHATELRVSDKRFLWLQLHHLPSPAVRGLRRELPVADWQRGGDAGEIKGSNKGNLVRVEAARPHWRPR